MRKIIHAFDIVLSVVCVVVMSIVAFGSYYLPDHAIRFDDKDVEFSSVFTSASVGKSKSVDYQLVKPSQQTLCLLGLIPIKNITVTTKPTKSVYVSGEAFGIKLYTDGVIVVGTQSVDNKGEKINPAKDAGIEVGDIIVGINGTRVYNSNSVEAIFNDNNGKSYKLKVKRGGRYRSVTLYPAYSDREGCYKAGMWVRDSTAGIGTITYYDQSTGYYGALGHQINDVDTNEIMPVFDGEAVSATVTDVQKSSRGSTGSLVCDFGENVVGTLMDNTSYGIFGAYTGISDKAKKYTVAPKQDIKRGKAQMICTIDSNGPQKYDIEISHINYSEKNLTQNMVIKVTDKRLIDATGGIVQGMSGSPIIQNGKLVGAVTHVIVDNPKKGYAIFAETMIEKCK